MFLGRSTVRRLRGDGDGDVDDDVDVDGDHNDNAKMMVTLTATNTIRCHSVAATPGQSAWAWSLWSISMLISMATADSVCGRGWEWVFC